MSILGYTYLLLAFISNVHYSYAKPGYETFDKLDDTASTWAQLPDTVDPSTPIELTVYLSQPKEKIKAFEKALIDMSTPGNPSYGKHMAQSQIDAVLQPLTNATDMVQSWLKGEGLSNFVFGNDWIAFNSTIEKTESLLQTTYKQFKSSATNETVIRTLSYSLPVDLHWAVDLIEPTTDFPFRKRKLLQQRADASNSDSHNPKHAHLNQDPSSTSDVTPARLAELYGYDNFKPPEAKSNKIGVLGFQKQIAQESDLALFLTTYAPDKTNASFTCVGAASKGICHQRNKYTGNPKDIKSGEANLDIQYTVTGTYPYENIFYQFGRLSDMKTLNYLLSLDTLPQTLSISWGMEERFMSKRLANKICNKYAQLGARGVSVLVASGDDGVGDESDTRCKKKKGKARVIKFLPEFPSTCPFVTSVGATDLTDHEEASSFSGGGFSWYFDRPEYQNATVNRYVTELGASDIKRNNGYFKPSGRAYPDVTAVGSDYCIINKGVKKCDVLGTSASAPVFASIVTLLNGERLSNGRSSLGFLNPWLYKNLYNAGGLKDIVQGKMEGCLKTKPEGSLGFSAVEGWDPASGLGSPIFKTMRANMS
ncbi:polynucleotide 3'-phosphatase [Orbilia ellipsospora]|uniref:Polynucleotide 3'-phosphatase n=1 Tax=Orbilia ellipsospora TaxID=2528407 RepID=A0AAV9XIZ9_9PEZI